MSSATDGEGFVGHARDNLDVLVFAAFFAFFIVDSFNYHETTRQFPLIFLVAGLVFLSMEFVIDLLPARYARTLRQVTTGITEDIDEMAETDDEADESPTGPEEDASIWNVNFLKITALLVFLLVATYLVGYLIAAVLFVFLAAYAIGSGNLAHAAILAVFLTVLIYGVFGELLNVAIFDGIYNIPDMLGWRP